MIGKLKGVVDSQGPDFVILDVGGVGYELFCSGRTLAALPAPGGAVALAVDTHVREDQIRLYGFASETERGWFRLLQTVQGVGARVALGVLSTLSVAELANAIALQDRATVARAPGVGPKVAQRIVAELKEKAGPLAAVDPSLIRLQDDLGAKRAPEPVADAVSALVNLGYAQTQAGSAVAAAMRTLGEGAKAEELIRFGLKELAR